MADDEDDYLSDKFLVESASASSNPKTYAERRKEAQREAQIRNEANRRKSRRQREQESREEGLSKSLFERAKEEEASGINTGGIKALSMMMKMGFKPGQALGRSSESSSSPVVPAVVQDLSDKSTDSTPVPVAADQPKTVPKHKTEPIPLNEWTGKQGIGVSKRPRPPSPTSAERVAKMAKMAETTSHETYRDRARQDYEERRADGRLVPAQSTCTTLDEKSGKTFNVLWLNPQDPDSFPEGLMVALTEYSSRASENQELSSDAATPSRLRLQMQADALRPIAGLDEDDVEESTPDDTEIFSSETIKEAIQFLRLNAQDRLRLVLSYLRDKYAYCFWCGTQYDDLDEMDEQCPGPEEEDHD